jgi:ribonuclease HIII
MINNENEIKEIVEAIRKSMNLEELDGLEKNYNQMYKELKDRENFLKLREEAKYWEEKNKLK